MGAFLIKQLFHSRLLDMRLVIANARSWNNCLIFPSFQNCARCEKDLKDNKDNSLHLGQKHARIFVLGRYLFLVAHSFPGASLSENCTNIRAYFRARWRLLVIYRLYSLQRLVKSENSRHKVFTRDLKLLFLWPEFLRLTLFYGERFIFLIFTPNG